MRTLILNRDGNPISISSWIKSFTLVYIKGVAIELDFYKTLKVKDTKGRNYPVPAVIMLKKQVPYRHFMVAFSKRNVLLRDNFLCQYCGYAGSSGDLNFDHIIPKSRWTAQTTPTNWQNIVTCCYRCNEKKGNKLLHEVGMKLLKHPGPPRRQDIIRRLAQTDGKIPLEWEPYIGEH